MVGSEAVEFFKEKGWDVVGIDANMRHKFFGTPEKSNFSEVDIRNIFELELLFHEHKFDAIIHAAAQPSHDYSKEHVIEDFHINATGTLHLLEMARKHCPGAVFVHCSTDKVYGEGMIRKEQRTDGYPRAFPLEEGETRYHCDQPFNEDTEFKPPYSPFGVSKLAADFYVQEYAAQGWLTTGVFRMGCITGRKHEGAEQHGFLAYLAKCIKEGKTYNIYGYKGKQVRDQIHAHDLVSAFWHFVQNPQSGAVYNMGGGPERSVSVLEAGESIAQKLGKEFKYELVDEPRFGDRQWDVHEMSKFRTDYPEWDYRYTLDDIVTDLCHD